ncbi:MAG: ATP-binding cassette domain-containing protein [Phormidium sp. SL48-SHIP]|nr:MAG: ATP-binding cassette domain-containing protein [Phormidium sp. SL48-SHIP]
MTSSKTTLVNQAPAYLEFNFQGKIKTFSLMGDRLTFGRAPDVDLTLEGDEWAAISRYHATLTREGDSYSIYDGVLQGQDHQFSRNGLLCGQRRVGTYQPHILQDGDELQIGQDPRNLVRLKYINPNAPRRQDTSTIAKSISLKQRSLEIGRDPALQGSNLYLDAPVISRRHAIIDNPGQGYVLYDKSTNGIFITRSGKVFKARSQEKLQDGDLIRIGPYALILKGDELLLEGRGDGLRIDAIQLSRQVNKHPEDFWEQIQFCLKQKIPKKFSLLNNVSVPIEPGQLVALVGGSGAGKSTLLETLLGIRPVDRGSIYLNSDDLRRNFNIYRTQIGYVPQQDIVHRNLSVTQVLTFAAQLRLPPDTDDAAIAQIVQKTLKTVALSDRTNSLVSQLSGGQLKRVSIAVELLANPKLFFLDEPTSGLDPGLDKKVMELLRDLAKEENRTVALVTHATANITLCDRVAFMGRGGNLCYFGDPNQAIPFFNDFVKSQGHHHELDGFAEIYIELDKPPEENQGIKPEAYCQRCAEFFRNHPSYQTYVERQLVPISGSPSGVTSQSPKTVSGPGSAPQNQSPQQATPSPWRQLSVLLQRDIQLVFADKFNLALALLTAPIGIGLITFAIRDREPFILPTEPDPTLAPLALRVLFVFTCAAIWVGLSGSLQTIVRESAIYLRERLVNLGLIPYLGSKVLVLAGLALIQTLLMTAVILLGFESPEPQLISWTMGVSVTAFLTLLTSGCLGLAVSCFVSNETQANTALPLLLLPQIIFSGVLFSMEGVAKFISWVMLSRWSVGAYGALVNVNEMVPEPQTYPDGTEIPQAFEVTPVYDADWSNLGLNWAILGVHACVYLAIALWRLKQKDTL